MGRVSRSTFLLVGFCAATLAGSASSALASSGLVRVGTAPVASAGSKVLGSLARTTRIGVTVTLEPRDPAALAAYATAVSTPGSSAYHEYLSVSQFRARFAPTAAQIAAVESWLRSRGLSLQAVTANGLAIPVAATSSAQLAQAFSTSFERVRVPGGRIAFANASAPALGANVAGAVQGVLGLDDLSLPHPEGLHGAALHARRAVVPRDLAASAPHVATGGPQPCAAASATQPDGGGPDGTETVFTADQIASAYSYPSLYAAGDFGQGVSVAIYELEPNLHSDITAFQSCYGTDASVGYDEVDGGAGTFNAGDGDGIETELDIETIIGLAPNASITVYQGPNSDSGGPGAGPYDTYSAMITADTAKVISSSWGECETDEGSTDADSESTLFQEAATQGQSIFAASGDDGAEDCYDSDETDQLSIDDPGSQPFVTGAGGAELDAIGPPPTETSWNDSDVDGGDGAGGGGISNLWPMPSYQSGAPASLNVINTHSSRTPCGAASGSYCREDPDVSGATSAEGESAVYWDGDGTAGDAGAWIGVWGTSWAAPQWAALAAVTDSTPACATSPIGFVNPDLYKIAGSSAYSSTFTDVTSGNNDYTVSGNSDGLYPAGTGYDMATGLGTPIASGLASYLCVGVSNPGTQATVVGTAVNLAVTGTSGATLTYSATGLPAGLSINPSTGAVSGSPTTPGTSTVTIEATSTVGVSGTTSFTWDVFARAVSVTAVANQVGIVGIPVAVPVHAVDNDGGALSYAATGLPAGVSINASTGVISGVPTTPEGVAVTVKATDATGPSASTTFTWAVVAAGSFSKGSLSGVGKGKPKLSFTVTAVTGAPAIKTIVIGLPKGLTLSSKAKHIAKGVSVKGSKFTAKVSHGKLTITLKTAAPSAKVTISKTELSVSKSLEKKVAKHKVTSLSIDALATNAGNTAISAVLKLGV